jgi:hypothetical protein
MESVQRSGQLRLDLRVVGGLAAALAIGITAGYLTATLTSQSSSKVVSRAPAAVAAPSAGVWGDHDSRLPIATGAAASAGVYGDHDSRLPIATGAGLTAGSVWGDRDSRLPYVSVSDAALLRAASARVTALQGLAGTDWSAAGFAASSDHDSRPPLAPFNGR